MYIGAIMHTDLITVSPTTTLVEANEIIKKKKIAHLLVVDAKKKLVGIVSDRDVKKYWASPATSLSVHELNYLLERVEVSTVMIKTVLTVSTNTTIERAAFIMEQNRIGALPVMEDNELVGIITVNDVFEVLLKAIGMSDDSMRLSVFVKDSIGRLAEVADTLRDANVNILSVFCWPEEQYPGITQLVVRVSRQEGEKAMAALTAKDFVVTDNYTKDLASIIPR